MALRRSGQVVLWGAVNRDLLRGPSELHDVIDLATSGDHILALRANGLVLAWGDDRFGAASVPDTLSGVVSIDASENRSLALKADGSVVTWGRATSESLVPPEGFEIVAMSAASSRTTVGLIAPRVPIISSLEKEFALVGQSVVLTARAQGLGLRYRWEKQGVPLQGLSGSTLELSSVSFDDAGRYTVFVTDWDGHQVSENTELFVVENGRPPIEGTDPAAIPGSVVAWGLNTVGQLSVPAGLDDVIAVSVYGNHTMALRSNGQVVAWGGVRSNRAVPESVNDVVAIAAGLNHSMALRRDGKVTAWGGNTRQQISIPRGVNGVVGITAGAFHSLALLEDGTVRAWGAQELGQTAIPIGLENVSVVKAGANHSLALKIDGTVVVWGDDRFGQSSVPEGLRDVVDVAAADRYSVALKADGSLVGWGGDNIEGVIASADLTNLVGISANGGRILTIFADGRIGFLGEGASAQVLGAFGGRSVIGAALGATHGVAIVSPDSPIFRSKPESMTVCVGHRVAFSVDALGAGPLRYQWFLNGNSIDGATESQFQIDEVALDDSGQLIVAVVDRWGHNSLASSELAVLTRKGSAPAELGNIVSWGRQVIGLSDKINAGHDLIALATGRNEIAGLRNDGSVAVQGSGSPDLVTNLEGVGEVESIAAGSSHALALKSDGTLVGWGSDRYGEATVPEGLFGVIAVAAGREHSVALKADRTMIAWGASFDGRTSFPDSWEDIVAIAAGGEFTLALRSDGTVLGRGANSDGQLSFPQGLDQVVAIAAGGRHSLALKSTGEVVAWGLDDRGQASVPSLLGGVLSIAAGENHSVALKSNGEIVTWGSNRFGQLNHPRDLSHVIEVSAGLGTTAVIVRAAVPGVSLVDLSVQRLEQRAMDSQLLLFLGDSSGNEVSRLEGIDLRLESTPYLGVPRSWQARPFEIDLQSGAILVDQDQSLTAEFFRIIEN